MKEWKPLRYDGGGDVHVGDLCKRMSDGGLVYLVIGEVLPTPPEDGYLLLPVIYSGRHDVGTVFDRDRRSLFIVGGRLPNVRLVLRGHGTLLACDHDDHIRWR